MINEIVVASKNKGKVSEIRKILEPINIKVLSMEDIGFNEDIQETGSTFEENAKIKAQEIYKKSGNVVLADDSGLEVEFLDNAPGVYSARFAPNDNERIKKLLNLMDKVPQEKRKARFVCAMVLFINNEEFIIKKGIVNGYITKEAKGTNGFGYDPVFYVPKYKKTMAELDIETKNRISHRAKALEQIIETVKLYNK